MDVAECLCQPGFYQPEIRLNGAPCTACPEGATCEGLRRVTVNNDNQTTAAAAATTATATADAAGTPEVAVWSNAYPYPQQDYFGFKADLLNASAGYSPLLWQCAPGRCAGGPNFEAGLGLLVEG